MQQAGAARGGPGASKRRGLSHALLLCEPAPSSQPRQGVRVGGGRASVAGGRRGRRASERQAQPLRLRLRLGRDALQARCRKRAQLRLQLLRGAQAHAVLALLHLRPVRPRGSCQRRGGGPVGLLLLRGAALLDAGAVQAGQRGACLGGTGGRWREGEELDVVEGRSMCVASGYLARWGPAGPLLAGSSGGRVALLRRRHACTIHWTARDSLSEAAERGEACSESSAKTVSSSRSAE